MLPQTMARGKDGGVNIKRTPESAELTALIVLLRDRTGLSWRAIVARLAHDFDIELTHAAVWQRYQREKHNGT
jgi:hypothetical protein